MGKQKTRRPRKQKVFASPFSKQRSHIPTPDTVAWTLLENGIDFVRVGVEAYYAESNRAEHTYKHTILNLHAGVLLLWKERLHRAHPALVYANVDHPLGKQGEPKTVTFEQAVGRLSDWAKHKLTYEQHKLFVELQHCRNNAEHGAVELNKKRVERLVTGIVEYIFHFLHDELSVDLEQHLAADAWAHLAGLRAIAKRLQQKRVAQWKAIAGRYQRMNRTTLTRLAGEPYHPKHNPSPVEALECEECGSDSVYYDVDETSGIGVLVCTNPDCRVVYPVGACDHCSSMVLPNTDLCETCSSYVRNVWERD